MRHASSIATSIVVVCASALLTAGSVLAASCAANPDVLGVHRTVEIDTTGGPGFGFEHYKAHDFLQPKEVILTFDDGPQKIHTEVVLAALAAQCTKATFFSIGKMALGYPEILRDVVKQGHTVGTHTWSHADLRAPKNQPLAVDEIEKGISAVRRAAGAPIAPFFRYPALHDTKATLDHLASRNIAVFSTDIDSFDFKFRSPDQLVKTVMAKLEKRGKGILLMHDIQPGTSKAVPALLAELKAQGYKIVHMKPKFEVKTVADYDALIEKDVKGLAAPGAEKATSSIVKTVVEPTAPQGGAAAAAAAVKSAIAPAKKP